MITAYTMYPKTSVNHFAVTVEKPLPKYVEFYSRKLNNLFMTAEYQGS